MHFEDLKSDTPFKPPKPPRKIIHIDMDCFFAAVEIKHQPDLKGKPVAIGGPPNSRSVLCTANYEARQFGVKAAMPSSQAVRRCPDLILIPPHFELYSRESHRIRQIFQRYTCQIEPLSLDEAYLDVTGSSLFDGSATRIAMEIKKNIFHELQLTASAGVAPNKFLAKVASDWQKPNGLTVITPKMIPEFVKKLPIESLYGVGKVTAAKMHKLGLKNCADIQGRTPHFLQEHFGSRAQELWRLAQGIDDRPVQSNGVRKSVSVEETFNKDIADLSSASKEIETIYLDLIRRLDKQDYWSRVRGLVIKIKFFDFQSISREQIWHPASLMERPTRDQFYLLLQQAWSKSPKPFRLLGLGVRLGSERSNEPYQLELFSELDVANETKV